MKRTRVLAYLIRQRFVLLLAIVCVGAGAFAAAMLINIFERKSELRYSQVRAVELSEQDTDPAKWGINWPRQYDSYRRTIIATRTRF